MIRSRTVDPIDTAHGFVAVVEPDATERTSNRIGFITETSHTVRFGMTEDCPEAVPLSLTEPEWGGTRKPCDG